MVLLVMPFFFWALLYGGSMYRNWEAEDREQIQALREYEENRRKKKEEKLRKQGEKKAKKWNQRWSNH